MGFFKKLFNKTSDHHRETPITVICPLCGGKTYTDERALGCLVPCPHCGKKIVFNIVEGQDGSLQVQPHDRLELHDLSAMLWVATQKLERTQAHRQENETDSTRKREKPAHRIDSLSISELRYLDREIRKCRALYRRKQPLKELVTRCENLILEEWAYLDDLPRELANTGANIYYNYCELHLLTKAVQDGRISESDMLSELGLDRMKPDYADLSRQILPIYAARVMNDYTTINEMINDLRQIDEKENPEEYQMGVDFTLCVMKYDIDAKAITAQRREVVEQQYRESIPDEIPDLIDFLHV